MHRHSAGRNKRQPGWPSLSMLCVLCHRASLLPHDCLQWSDQAGNMQRSRECGKLVRNQVCCKAGGTRGTGAQQQLRRST